MRISDWSSDVCSSDLWRLRRRWGRCAGADFRAPEIEPRATARPGMAHQRVIHRIIGAQAACLKSAASPIWIGGIVDIKTENAGNRAALMAHRPHVGGLAEQIGRAHV